MNIVCDKCQSKFKIPDDKIPTGKSAVLSCPKCKNKLTVAGKPAPSAADNGTVVDASASADNLYDSLMKESYNDSDRPFDYLEEDAKTAIICEANEEIKKKITEVLNTMGYYITDAEDGRDALRKMRYHQYDLVFLNEEFDTEDPDSNGVLIYLQNLIMPTRRDMYVILLTNRFRTMDNMMGFNKSVNLIVNLKNIGDIDKIIKRGKTESSRFYKIYYELRDHV